MTQPVFLCRVGVGVRAGLTGLCLALCLPLIPAAAQSEVERRDSREAAAEFAEKVEEFIATLPATRERFDIRINRCENARGEMRDDIYAVWIGARLAADEDNADRLLIGVVDDWREESWEIIRNRLLDNGGVNVAAIDPSSGDSYSLDSGFKSHPRRDIVGLFSTPCFAEPGGAAPFGPVLPD